MNKKIMRALTVTIKYKCGKVLNALNAQDILILQIS